MLLPAWRQYTLTSIAHLQVVTLRTLTKHQKSGRYYQNSGIYFSRCNSHWIWEHTLGKFSFRDRWEDLARCICYWWAHVHKLHYNNIYNLAATCYWWAHVFSSYNFSQWIVIHNLLIFTFHFFCFIIFFVHGRVIKYAMFLINEMVIRLQRVYFLRNFSQR